MIKKYILTTLILSQLLTASAFAESTLSIDEFIKLIDQDVKTEKAMKRRDAAKMINQILELKSEDIGLSDSIIFTEDYDSIMNVASNGIIKAYPDNTFRPDEYLSKEQIKEIVTKLKEYTSSRSKGNDCDVPVDNYWTDKEFIEYMNETEVYNQWGDTTLAHTDKINGILIDKTGYVTFADNLGFNANYDFENYDRSKWIKPLAYNLTKRLGYYAKENGNHVHFTNGMSGNSVVKFEYYETNKYTATSPPCFSLIMYKDIQTHAGKGREYNIGISIYGLSNPYDENGNLLSMAEIEKIKVNNNITDDIVEALRISMVELFGEVEGNEFTKCIVDNYIKRVSDKSRKTYVDSYEKLKVGKYDIILSDYVDRTDNTWGATTRYNFIIK